MEKALEGLPGVIQVKASYPEKKATVIYEPASVTMDQMRWVLLKAGYVASSEGIPMATGTDGHDEPFQSTNTPIDHLVCYCFEYTRDDIGQDVIKNGKSLIMEKIMGEKRAGGCDCAAKNPRGR